jgi:hypothetical protein
MPHAMAVAKPPTSSAAWSEMQKRGIGQNARSCANEHARMPMRATRDPVTTLTLEEELRMSLFVRCGAN